MVLDFCISQLVVLISWLDVETASRDDRRRQQQPERDRQVRFIFFRMVRDRQPQDVIL